MSDIYKLYKFHNARNSYHNLGIACVIKCVSLEAECLNSNCNITQISHSNMHGAQGCHLVNESILICVTNIPCTIQFSRDVHD